MNVARLIARKRDGGALSCEEIRRLVDGYVGGAVPDYQMAALAMAVYLRGMTAEETAALTDAMLRSGSTLEWEEGSPPVVDKHSTGGVGDKVSLVLAPLLACCDLRVPMLSGRGLGPTGGTLDKLESIPGLRTDLEVEEITALATAVGCVITGATREIAPADRKLYALRDVTATVASIPLITASIMAKKLAEGLNALVLDVKTGSGSFMKSTAEATALARSLVAVGQAHGVPTVALLSDMSQPLGRKIGNALEVDEAVETLAGNGPADLVELVCALGAEALVATGRAPDTNAAADTLRRLLAAGDGLPRLRRMVEAQGGDLDAPRPLAAASEVCATAAGFLTAIDTEALGQAVIELGGGRKITTDAVDPGVGLEMLTRLGDRIERGQPLVRLFARPGAGAEEARRLIDGALEVGERAAETRPLLLDRVAAED